MEYVIRWRWKCRRYWRDDVERMDPKD